MIRFILLLFVCLPGVASAQELAGRRFDAELLAKVQTEAIEFMVPRALEPVTAAQLAIWGLSGLTAIDPALSVAMRDKRVQLLLRGRIVLDTPAPGPEAGGWAQLAASVVTVAYDASPALRRTGQTAITRILFDEMLAHLDPYSRYLPPFEAVGDRDRRVGQAGIGVTLAYKGRNTVVRDIVIGSPGAQAGIGAGDTIEWIDGRTALGRDPATVARMLAGPEGTEMRLGWLGRDGMSRSATLTRVMIPPETVFQRRVGDTVIVQITGFSQNTDQHVSQAMTEHLKGPRPIKAIVLDLRGNRGGLLRAAVATADLFLSPGVVVRSTGRAPETNRIWLSTEGELAKAIPMVVLVDAGTASAAEVLAAALADRGRAVVAGSSTFGKGVVQTIDPLPDGGELFLTWSRLLAPRGWPIQSLGVMPQICTSQGEDSLRKQLASLAAGRWDMAEAVAAHRAARAPVTPDQIVSIRERCPAADPRDSDVTAALTVVENPATHAAALFEAMTEER